MPINLIPSMGDRPTGMSLAAGLLAALYRAEKTGKGDKVTTSLLGDGRSSCRGLCCSPLSMAR